MAALHALVGDWTTSISNFLKRFTTIDSSAESSTNDTLATAMAVCLDETNRYFILREPKAEPRDPEAILTVEKDQVSETFEEMCDDVNCRQKSHIFCYGCAAFSHAICPDHPIVLVSDRKVRKPANAVRSMPNFLRLKRSGIPNAGRGVFSKIFIPAGTAFGPYAGTIVENGKNTDSQYDYAWKIKVPGKNVWVDGQDPNRSNFLRWVNSARFREEQNMVTFQFQKRIYYVVCKPVSPGEELLVWYGRVCGQRLGIKNLNRATKKYAPPKAKRDPKAIMSTWRQTRSYASTV